METENNLPLNEWGKAVQKRLDRLGKDREWICHMVNITGWQYRLQDLEKLMTGQAVSRPKEVNVEKILSEEEDRQRLKRMIGIKR